MIFGPKDPKSWKTPWNTMKHLAASAQLVGWFVFFFAQGSVNKRMLLQRC
jgi:hypothetical protein